MNSYRSQVAAEIKEFRPQTYFNERKAERTDRSTQFALLAAKMAIDDAGIDFARADRYRSGVCIGSGMGGMTVAERQRTELYRNKQAYKVHPDLVPMNTMNAPSGQIAIDWGLKGPNLTIATACSSGAHATCAVRTRICKYQQVSR